MLRLNLTPVAPGSAPFFLSLAVASRLRHDNRHRLRRASPSRATPPAPASRGRASHLTAEAGLPSIARGRRDLEWTPQQAAHEELVTELLQHNLPATRAALRRGDISYRHAQAIIDNTEFLPIEARRSFENEALRNSETLTVPQLEKKYVKVRELTHPESIAIRHQRALADRRFWVSPGRNGMGHLDMTFSNEDATAISDRIEAIAKN